MAKQAVFFRIMKVDDEKPRLDSLYDLLKKQEGMELWAKLQAR